MFQPPEVWAKLLEQGVLYVDESHERFADNSDQTVIAAYDWMRQQMHLRIPGYEWHYPWWAYTHFLDLRFYRFHTWPPYTSTVRIELCLPADKVLLSSYDAWHCVLNRQYLPDAPDWDSYERDLDAWEDQVRQVVQDASHSSILCEPWESRLRASWERIFDGNVTASQQVIQATFEQLNLSNVRRATMFMPIECRNNPIGAQE